MGSVKSSSARRVCGTCRREGPGEWRNLQCAQVGTCSHRVTSYAPQALEEDTTTGTRACAHTHAHRRGHGHRWLQAPSSSAPEKAQNSNPGLPGPALMGSHVFVATELNVYRYYCSYSVWSSFLLRYNCGFRWTT